MVRTPEQIIGRDRLLQLVFEGYAVVPVEPTQKMLDEVCCDSPYPTIVARDDVMRSIYKNMLDAFEPLTS